MGAGPEGSPGPVLLLHEVVDGQQDLCPVPEIVRVGCKGKVHQQGHARDPSCLQGACCFDMLLVVSGHDSGSVSYSTAVYNMICTCHRQQGVMKHLWRDIQPAGERAHWRKIFRCVQKGMKSCKPWNC